MTEKLESFRELHARIVEHQGEGVFDALLMPQIAPARQLLGTLASHAHLPERPGEKPVEELWQWYALSRVSDRLLLGTQASSECYVSPQQAAQPVGDWWRYGLATKEQYREFFAALGFAPFGFLPFSPFHHEIVEVAEDPALTESLVVDHVFWPGLMFGEMLFARAGVRVRCPAGHFQKAIAENSLLYFAYDRLRRKTEDLSDGWGSNSQWRTSFRRDYDSGGMLYYNVDGEHPLGPDYEASFNPAGQGTYGHWTVEERIELLTHRCFVRCPKDDTDCWPYDDTFQEANSA